MPSANALVTAIEWYLRIGLGVGLLFSIIASRVEPSARGGSLLFRLAIVPGAALLWPLVVVRTIRAVVRPRPEGHA